MSVADLWPQEGLVVSLRPQEVAGVTGYSPP